MEPTSFFESKPGTPEDDEQSGDQPELFAASKPSSLTLAEQANDELELLAESTPLSPITGKQVNEQPEPEIITTLKTKGSADSISHSSGSLTESRSISSGELAYASSTQYYGPSDPISELKPKGLNLAAKGINHQSGPASDFSSRIPMAHSQAPLHASRQPELRDSLPLLKPEALKLGREATTQPTAVLESGFNSPKVYSQPTSSNNRQPGPPDTLPDLTPDGPLLANTVYQPPPLFKSKPKSPNVAAQPKPTRPQESKYHAGVEATQIQNELGAVTEAMTAMRIKLREQRLSNAARYSLTHTERASVQSVPKTEMESTVPAHPIESMQAAFVESLEEASKQGAGKPRLAELDGPARRERLLDQGKDEEPYDAIWRYRPGQTQHEVLKLVSQISFGVYLLFNGMANDNSQVVGILQGHIDEVDEFLEIVLEDLALASADLNERIDCLKLPMAKVKVFEELLEDRVYRAEILEGNEKIEKVQGRMDLVMKQWDDDVDAGLQGATAFTEWLSSMKNGSWRADRPDLEDIFEAMKGNADGWLAAFDEINSRAQDLNDLLNRLRTLVYDIEKMAGEVSRRTWVGFLRRI